MATVTVQSQGLSRLTNRTTLHTTPAIEFKKADSSFPRRLVGSYEYEKALQQLGRLVETSSPEEVEVYDRLISHNKEYAFYSGVAIEKGIDAKAGQDDTSNSEFDSQFLKHSLAWMMALARVELGATMSMYGEFDDPFGQSVSIGGQRFGAQEYLQVLVDDLSAHLKAAKSDPLYQRALDRKSDLDGNTMSHLRRTTLINDLLTKVSKSGVPEIVTQAQPYVRMAQEYAEQMVEKIQAATTTVALGTTQTQHTRAVGNDQQLTGVRFHDRDRLTTCQKMMENRLGPPQEYGTALQR